MPDNAETELLRAYNSALEAGATIQGRSIPGIFLDEVFALYQRAMDAYHRGGPQQRQIAERWARAVKHLALACWSESKIHYLERHSEDLPHLTLGGVGRHLKTESRETAQALLEAAEQSLSEKQSDQHEMAMQLLTRGKEHLERLAAHDAENTILHAERIRAAHEYGRTLEYCLLALEAEASAAPAPAA